MVRQCSLLFFPLPLNFHLQHGRRPVFPADQLPARSRLMMVMVVLRGTRLNMFPVRWRRVMMPWRGRWQCRIDAPDWRRGRKDDGRWRRQRRRDNDWRRHRRNDHRWLDGNHGRRLDRNHARPSFHNDRAGDEQARDSRNHRDRVKHCVQSAVMSVMVVMRSCLHRQGRQQNPQDCNCENSVLLHV